MDHDHPRGERRPTPAFWTSPLGIVCTLAAIGASVWLWVAHRNHLLALLPYAFLAACPLMHLLMHLLMHRGHGHRHGGQGHAVTGNPDAPHGRQGG